MPHTYHSNARTTVKLRKEIQESKESISAIARRLNISRDTVRKWKKRATVDDRSSRPHCLNTKLTELEEYVIVEVRKSILLPLDDLLIVMKEFIPHLSRAALARCLARHGVSNLKEMLPKEEKEPLKRFKDYEPGYLHIDIKELPKLGCEKSYLFVSIDRATRLCYFSFKGNKSAQSAIEFLEEIKGFYPYKINKILTDNGKEFTDRYIRGRTKASGEHPFDKACQPEGIEHRLIKPYTPKTNGMVERMNGRVEAILKTTYFDNHGVMKKTLKNYLNCYNLHIKQRALDYKSPWDKVLEWYKLKPEIFKDKPAYFDDNLPRPDNFAYKICYAP
jgi:transposase